MRQIPVYKRKAVAGFALVDDADHDALAGRRWLLDANGYARRTWSERKPEGGWRSFCSYMHREVVRPAAGLVTDHIDGNKLNNQRSNLRACLHAENLRNRGPSKRNKCGLKGASWSAGDRRWRAQINDHGKTIHLGNFLSAAEAHAAYAAAALARHGAFANTGSLQ